MDSYIHSLDPDSFRKIASDLSFEDISSIIESYPDRLSYLNETFWRDRGKLDLGIPAKNINEYLEILSHINGVTYGSEAYLDLNICLFRAVALDDRNLLQYFSDLGADLSFIYSGALVSGNEELLNFSRKYTKDSLWTAYCSGLSETPYSGIYVYAHMAGKERIGKGMGPGKKIPGPSRAESIAPYRFNPYYQRGVYGNLNLIRFTTSLKFNILIILGGYLTGDGSIKAFMDEPLIRGYLDEALNFESNPLVLGSIGYLTARAPKHRSDEFLSLLDFKVRKVIIESPSYQAGKAWHHPYNLTADMVNALEVVEQNDLLGEGYLKWMKIILNMSNGSKPIREGLGLHI